MRERYRAYLSTVWRGTPVGDFVVGQSPVPERPFVIVTAAYPRRRAHAEARGVAIVAADAAAEDERLNALLAERIREAGGEPLSCVGAEANGPHQEASFWVWDAAAPRAIAWGREFDQFAIVAGDGKRAGILSCFPEHEPPTAPDLIALLGPPEVLALLERELRSRGWDRETRYLRALEGAEPILAIGVGSFGIAAAASSAPWRCWIQTPWREIPEPERGRLFDWTGLAALHGGADENTTLDLAALPATVARLVEPEAGADPATWIGRIADGVMRVWSSPLRPMAAAAAGWKTPGFASATPGPAPKSLCPGGLMAAIGTLLAILFAAFSLMLALVWLGRLYGGDLPDPGAARFIDAGLITAGFALLFLATAAAALLFLSERSRKRWRIIALITSAGGLVLCLLGELALLAMDVPPGSYAVVFVSCCIPASGGIVALLVPAVARP